MTEPNSNEINFSPIKLTLKFLLNNLKVFPFLQFFYLGLIVGGIWSLIFFMQIGSLPEIEISQLTTLLISTAIGGIFITLFLGIYFMLPSMFIEMIWQQAYEPTDISLGKQYVQKQSRIFIITSGLCCLIAIFLLIAFAVYLNNKNINTFEHWSLKAAICFVVLIFAWREYYLCKFGHNYIQLFFPKKQLVTCGWLIVLWLFASASLLIVIAEPLSAATRGNELSIDLGNIVLFVTAVFLFNHFIIKPKSLFLKIIVGVVCGLSLLFLFVYLKGSASLIKAPFNALGLGNIKQAELVVTKQACSYVNAQSANICKIDEVHDFGVIKGITIVSNIGNELIITANSKPEKNIFIQKDQRLSWSITSKAK